jgi:hypothetical protein
METRKSMAQEILSCARFGGYLSAIIACQRLHRTYSEHFQFVKLVEACCRPRSIPMNSVETFTPAANSIIIAKSVPFALSVRLRRSWFTSLGAVNEKGRSLAPPFRVSNYTALEFKACARAPETRWRVAGLQCSAAAPNEARCRCFVG